MSRERSRLNRDSRGSYSPSNRSLRVAERCYRLTFPNYDGSVSEQLESRRKESSAETDAVFGRRSSEQSRDAVLSGSLRIDVLSEVPRG